MNGIAIAPVPYVCRVCTAETPIYVSAEKPEDVDEFTEDDVEYVLDLTGTNRLQNAYCGRCEEDRTMVAKPAVSEGST